jgi:hypothetical protein
VDEKEEVMEFFLFLIMSGFLLWYIFDGPGIGDADSWSLLDIVGLLVVAGGLIYLGVKGWKQLHRKRS